LRSIAPVPVWAIVSSDKTLSPPKGAVTPARDAVYRDRRIEVIRDPFRCFSVVAFSSHIKRKNAIMAVTKSA
jgi:hypothetical protein